MSLLAAVTTGHTKCGIRMLIAAQEKMGKTTMCAGAPGVLLVPLEVGFAGVQVPKTPMIQSYSQFIQFINEVTTAAQQGKFPFRTLAFDSITALERHIHNHVIAMDPASQVANKKIAVTMESAHGGYGRAYNMANTLMEEILKALDVLAVLGGINIVFTCHVFSSKVADPTAGEYDSWDLLLHSPKNQKTYGKREIVTQWADVIGFLYEPIFISTTDGKRMSIGTSQNRGRVMAVQRTPAYTAGNRFGMEGEINIPKPPENTWNAFAQFLHDACGIDVLAR